MVCAGYKWVLQREGEEAHTSQQQAAPSGRERDRYGGARGMGRATPPELERLHSALQQKEEQLASFQETISELEATRDRLAPPICPPPHLGGASPVPSRCIEAATICASAECWLCLKAGIVVAVGLLHSVSSVQCDDSVAVSYGTAIATVWNP